MKQVIHYILIAVLGVLVIAIFMPGWYGNSDFLSRRLFEGLTALQISILWMYEYKFNLPMIVGPGTFKVDDVVPRKFFAMSAVVLFIGSIFFLLFCTP